MRRLMKVSAWIGAALALQVSLILVDGLRDEGEPADVAIVLGNHVHQDGTPSTRLRLRLDKGFELWRDGKVRAIIVSGGRGSEGWQEADVMRDYLLKLGVEPASIVADPEGVDTYHTARNAWRTMRERGWKSAVVVSQYYHVSRSKLAMRSFGTGRITGAHADVSLELRDLYSVPRELVGYWFYWLRSYEG